MPTYVYECEAGHRFEVDQKMSDDPVQTCQHESLCLRPCKRIIVGTSFVLKGSGWAKDGYSG
jgi:putative FmdB family regulatory protein